jgi:adenylate kinase family enzyme
MHIDVAMTDGAAAFCVLSFVAPWRQVWVPESTSCIFLDLVQAAMRMSVLEDVCNGEVCCFATGEPVPDEIVVEIVVGAIRRFRFQSRHTLSAVAETTPAPAPDTVSICVLDGFPANHHQAEILEQQVHQRIGCVVECVCPEELMIHRVLERARETGRVDDNESTVATIIDRYKRKCAPMLR